MGFAPASAADVPVWASVGGASGSLPLGLLSQRLPLLTLTAAAMIASMLLVIAPG